jgi:hypothetical protein
MTASVKIRAVLVDVLVVVNLLERTVARGLVYIKQVQAELTAGIEPLQFSR